MAVDDSYTKALLHMDGADNGTTFTDEAGNTVTVNGNACTKTGQKKFGTASGYFDGSGDYLSFGALSDLYVGTGKFTFDMWIRPTTLGEVDKVFFSYGVYATGFVAYVRYTDKKLLIYGANGDRIQSAGALSENTWYHIAIVGNGGANGSRNIKMYLNGTLLGTWTYDYNYSNEVIIGTDSSSVNHGLIGYIDEFRASVGVERWTTDFTPPTAPYGAAEPASEGIFFATFI